MKPTEPAAGQSRDRPPGPRTLRANPQRLHRILYQGRVGRVKGLGGALLIVLLVAVCTGGNGAESTTTTSSSSTSIPGVGGGLAEECADAADVLGYPVPCPTRLPGASCGTLPPGAEEGLEPCVAHAGGGETLDTVFSLEGHAASGSGAHLVIEARRVEKAPPVPCYKGMPRPSISAGGRTLGVLTCPENAEGADANIRHGEGAHVGHLLGYWDEGGIRYVVSVHDQSTSGRELLTDIASDVTLTDGA